MRTRPDCIFCQIVAGSAAAHRVAEDELTLAFMDLFPVSDGHTLVISKDHAENIFVPQHLAAPLPAEVSFEAAAFTTVGAIALQGLRLARAELGETVAIIGMGLVGLLAAQLARASGCQVNRSYLFLSAAPELLSRASLSASWAGHRRKRRRRWLSSWACSTAGPPPGTSRSTPRAEATSRESFPWGSSHMPP